MRSESAQVVIVGSGMAGGTLPWGLGQRGVDTLVLEQGEMLPRLRESDFARREYPSGLSLQWPFIYADLEQQYSQAESLYRVQGSIGEDPAEPWRSQPYPFPPLPHEPYVAETVQRLGDQGLHPSRTAMGVDLRPGGSCIRCATCDGFPCRLGAKSDAQTCALAPAWQVDVCACSRACA